MKIILGLMLTMFIFSTSAQAIVYLEPFAGISLGSGDVTYSDNTTGDLTHKVGYEIGGRIGTSFLGFFLTGEYTIGSLDFDMTSGSAVVTNEMTKARTAIVAGYDLPMIPLKAYGRYIIKDKYSYDAIESGVTYASELTYTGYGLGVAFTGLPFIHINFELNKLTGDQHIKAGSPDENYNADCTTYGVNVSFPLDF